MLTLVAGARQVAIPYTSAGTISLVSVWNVPIRWKPGFGIEEEVARQVRQCEADEIYYNFSYLTSGPRSVEGPTYEAQYQCVLQCITAGARACANTCDGCWASNKPMVKK